MLNRSLFIFNFKNILYLIKRLFIFITPVFICLSLIGYLVESGIKKSNHDRFHLWNSIINREVCSDLIVSGSSRAWVNISPKILSETLKLTVYNLGMDGYRLPMQMKVFDIYQKYCGNPTVLLQILDPHSFKKRKTLNQYWQFYPALSDPDVIKLTKNYTGFNFWHYFFPPYRYMMETEIIKIGLFEYFSIKKYHYTKYRGYKGLDILWDGKFDKFKKMNPRGILQPIDQLIVSRFDKFIKKVKHQNIKVILVFAPVLKELNQYIINLDEIIEIFKDIAKANDVIYIDYFKNNLSINQSLFYNSTHMNKKGSELLSKDLANKLKNYLKMKRVGK